MPALADTQSGQLGGLEWDDGVRVCEYGEALGYSLGLMHRTQQKGCKGPDDQASGKGRGPRSQEAKRSGSRAGGCGGVNR